MSTYVVVEGKPGARLVERILQARGRNAFTLAAGQRSYGIMLACSILAKEKQPTVLVIDSDTLEERAWIDEQAMIDGLLHDAAIRTPHTLVLAVPQVESVLFRDRAGLERALGHGIPDETCFEARFRPRAVIHRLLGDKTVEEREVALIDALDEPALLRMAVDPAIIRIERFIDSAQQRKDSPPRKERVRRAS